MAEDFIKNTIRGKKLSEHGQMYPSVGEYILTNIVDMYSPSGSDEIHMEVDIPENDGIWVFDYPYS